MRKLFYFSILLFCISCTSKEQEKVNTKTYFDLDTYFKKEATRLTKTNPSITKSVNVNGKTEQKVVQIKDWEGEFDSFINADINKASWRGSFNLTKTDRLSTYVSNDKKIPVKKLEVEFKGNQVMGIRIFMVNTTDLYTSQDSLSYYPDSLYQIKKTQKIRLMDLKHYEILGKFK